MLFIQRSSSSKRNGCFCDCSTTGKKVNPKILCLITLFLHCTEVCLGVLLSQQWPVSTSGATCSAVPMHPPAQYWFWTMAMLYLSCHRAHQDGQAKTNSLSHTDCFTPLPLLWVRHVYAREWPILSQPCPVPIPREEPNAQGWGCPRYPPAALLLTGGCDGPWLPGPALTPQEAPAAPGPQPLLCPNASPKQATIGSHRLLPCSITANSSSSLLLLSYLLHIYTISFSSSISLSPFLLCSSKNVH